MAAGTNGPSKTNYKFGTTKNQMQKDQLDLSTFYNVKNVVDSITITLGDSLMFYTPALPRVPWIS